MQDGPEKSAQLVTAVSSFCTSELKPHHIIVVGGGAGGLELATRLGDRLGRSNKARITLVEKSRTHVWKPRLYEMAAGSLDTARTEIDYLAQGHRHSFQFRYGEMTGIDHARREVQVGATFDEEGRQITPARSFAYDTLVVALGSVGNAFGTPGVMQHAIMLDTAEQAQCFNRRLINACVRAFAQSEPIRPGQLNVTIIGAGATGTELAELHRTVRSLIAFGLDNIDPDNDVKISLVEAADRILPALPDNIADATRNVLHKLRLDIRTKARVIEVTSKGVKLADGDFIPSELVVWVAGVKGPDVLARLDGLEVSRSNQLVVKTTLETTCDENILALGDCAHLVPKGGDAAGPAAGTGCTSAGSHLLGAMQRRLGHGGAHDVPLASHAARRRLAGDHNGGSRRHGPQADPPRRAARQAPLVSNREGRSMIPKGYWIVHISVADPANYPKYVAADAAVFAKRDARFLVRGGRFEAVEGRARQRHVVIEFDSYDTALACYHSSEHQAAELRQAHADSEALIVEGQSSGGPASTASW
jgi:NADH dehydrogenase